MWGVATVKCPAMSISYLAPGSVIHSGVIINSFSVLASSFLLFARRPGLVTKPSPIILFPVNPYLKEQCIIVLYWYESYTEMPVLTQLMLMSQQTLYCGR